MHANAKAIAITVFPFERRFQVSKDSFYICLHVFSLLDLFIFRYIPVAEIPSLNQKRLQNSSNSPEMCSISSMFRK